MSSFLSSLSHAAMTAAQVVITPIATVGIAVAALALMPRRFVTQQYAANYLGVTPRTIRNKISEGILVGYRLPGMRAVRVDLDEIDAKMKTIPATIGPRRQPFGPRAKIVTVVEEYRPEPTVNGAATPTQDADQDQIEAMAGGDR